MKLKNILIVVKDIEKSKQFYHDLFGLQVLRALPATMWNFFSKNRIGTLLWMMWTSIQKP